MSSIERPGPAGADHDLLIELRTLVGEMREDLHRMASGDMALCAGREERLKRVEEAVADFRDVLDVLATDRSVRDVDERVTSLQRNLLAVAAFAAMEAFAIVKMIFFAKG